MSSTTEKAKAAVDALRTAEPRWQRSEEHARLLRADAFSAPLGDILAQSEFAQMSARYETHSDLATKRQQSYQRNAARTAWSGFLAAVTAGVMLYASVTSASGISGSLLAGVYVICIVIAVGASLYLSFGKPHRKWVEARGKAERLRIAYFRQLFFAAPAGHGKETPDLSALKVEFIRAFLLEDQHKWFLLKAEAARKKSSMHRAWRIFAIVLVALASLPMVLSFLAAPWLAKWLATWLPAAVVDPLHVIGVLGDEWRPSAETLAFAGVIGAAIHALLTTLSAAAFSDRNALVYARAAKDLQALTEKDLESAREAAAAGDRTPIEAFWQKLSFVLVAEHVGWSDALTAAQLLTSDNVSPLLDGE